MGIALSGGTLKAAAHIGVLSALEEMGIRPHHLAGTSAGSIVATLYAYGYRDQELKHLIQQFPGYKLLDYGFPLTSAVMSTFFHAIPHRNRLIQVYPRGLIHGNKLKKYFHKLLIGRECRIPVLFVATDLLSGDPVIMRIEPSNVSIPQLPRALPIHQEELPACLLGSCALPAIFSPVPFREYLLADGAMRHYIPVQALRESGCTHILAINLYKLQYREYLTTFVDVLARSFEILLRESIDNDVVNSGDVLVIEPDFAKIKTWKFTEMIQSVRVGVQAVVKQQLQIEQFLKINPRLPHKMAK
ncbi:patatin [Alicyclobacillus sp. TC]|nr:patatin [Alicyclobacillus sp. TC]